MFKRTNKLWKGLALVLALCMISTVAYADPSTAVIENLAGEYDAATKTVTISGKITAPGNDVTILAVRGGEEYNTLAGVWTKDMLPSKVVYIDQETSNETTGEFRFSFVPRDGVSGGYISVFVGGEDVANVAPWSTEAKKPAPTLVLENEDWYEGVTELTFDLMSGDKPFEDADEWGSIIDDVIIDEVTIEPGNEGVACAYADGKVTFTGFDTTGESLEKIEITTAENVYAKAVWTEGIAQEKHDLGGNVLSASRSVVAPGEAEITVDTEDTVWKAALESKDEDKNVTVKVDGVSTTDYDLNGNILIVRGLDIANKIGNTKENVEITVEQNYYKPATVNVEVVAPTENQLTADNRIADSAIRVAYSSENGDEDAAANMGDEELNADNADTWGQASITLPAAPTAEFNYIWTIACADVASDDLPANAATGLATGTAVVLDRPDFGSDKGAFEYTLTLTIEDAREVSKEAKYADATKPYTLRVSEVGVVGVEVEVTPNFSNDPAVNAAIMASASFVLKDSPGETEVATLEYDSESNTFKAAGIVAGTYKLVISRPGYVTMTVDAVVDDALEVTLPTMIAGDIVGNDGKIDADDYMAIVSAWRTSDGDGDFNPACDIDASGFIDADDYMALVANWRYGY